MRIKYSKRDVEFHKGGGAHQDLAKLPFFIPSLNLFLPLGVDAAQDILRQDILRQEIQNKLCWTPLNTKHMLHYWIWTLAHLQAIIYLPKQLASLFVIVIFYPRGKRVTFFPQTWFSLSTFLVISETCYFPFNVLWFSGSKCHMHASREVVFVI